jgi:nitrite reductase (NO-forming)
VQSEFYLGPQGQPGDLTKMLANKPDAVVFNGYYNQYKSAPITDVKAGERVRIWVLDAGRPTSAPSTSSAPSSTPCTRKAHTCSVPGTAKRVDHRQALDLLPAQGGFVELSFAKPGMYLMVTHRFSDASIGGLGVFEIS